MSPLIIDPRHPFPNLRNTQLYVLCSLDSQDEQGLLGMVEVPSSVQRLISLPSAEGQYRYTLIEDVIRRRLAGVFGSYVPTSSAVIRITRNADIDPDGEGVEEEDVYHFLRDECEADAIQGFYFGRPEPEDVFEKRFDKG